MPADAGTGPPPNRRSEIQKRLRLPPLACRAKPRGKLRRENLRGKPAGGEPLLRRETPRGKSRRERQPSALHRNSLRATTLMPAQSPPLNRGVKNENACRSIDQLLRLNSACEPSGENRVLACARLRDEDRGKPACLHRARTLLLLHRSGGSSVNSSAELLPETLPTTHSRSPARGDSGARLHWSLGGTPQRERQPELPLERGVNSERSSPLPAPPPLAKIEQMF